MPHKAQLIETELSELLEIECDVRDLVKYVEDGQAANSQRGNTVQAFAPGTLEFVKKVKQHLEQLDTVRRSKAA
jgi:hypothetical protein